MDAIINELIVNTNTIIAVLEEHYGISQYMPKTYNDIVEKLQSDSDFIFDIIDYLSYISNNKQKGLFHVKNVDLFQLHTTILKYKSQTSPEIAKYLTDIAEKIGTNCLMKIIQHQFPDHKLSTIDNNDVKEIKLIDLIHEVCLLRKGLKLNEQNENKTIKRKNNKRDLDTDADIDTVKRTKQSQIKKMKKKKKKK